MTGLNFSDLANFTFNENYQAAHDISSDLNNYPLFLGYSQHILNNTQLNFNQRLDNLLPMNNKA